MITIIDYGLGNLGSVKNALDKLGVTSLISKSAFDLKRASGLILPGVGSAGEGMKNIESRKLDLLIKEQAKKGKPILGICLGMQLFMSRSEEGNCDCLAVIKGNVQKFKTKLKVPQIGWNAVDVKNDTKLFKGIPRNSYFYFVHSYYCSPAAKKSIVGETDYGTVFCSAIRKDNIYGVQFHPEKSGENGLRLLKNFINIVYENYSGN